MPKTWVGVTLVNETHYDYFSGEVDGNGRELLIKCKFMDMNAGDRVVYEKNEWIGIDESIKFEKHLEVIEFWQYRFHFSFHTGGGGDKLFGRLEDYWRHDTDVQSPWRLLKRFLGSQVKLIRVDSAGNESNCGTIDREYW